MKHSAGKVVTRLALLAVVAGLVNVRVPMVAFACVSVPAKPVTVPVNAGFVVLYGRLAGFAV